MKLVILSLLINLLYQFHDGTLFHNDDTGIIWAENSVFLGAGETQMGKGHFEQWLWELAAAEIHHLHRDNRIFNAELFVEDCKNMFQMQSFSGVGAHHHNPIVEWLIIGLGALWFIFLCTGASMVLIILLCGVLL